MLRDSKRKSAVNLFGFPLMPGFVLSLLQSFVCSREILNKKDLSSPLPPNEAKVKGQSDLLYCQGKGRSCKPGDSGGSTA